MQNIRIPKDNQQRWVPHCNIHYQMTIVHVKKHQDMVWKNAEKS